VAAALAIPTVSTLDKALAIGAVVAAIAAVAGTIYVWMLEGPK
jgi:hypothetical protein